MHLQVNCTRNSRIGIENLVGQEVFYVMAQNSQIMFDQYLKNCMAYLNFNAIFEFLEQYTIRCIYHFSKRG